MSLVMHLVEKTVLRCGHGGPQEYGMTTDAQSIVTMSVKKSLVSSF